MAWLWMAMRAVCRSLRRAVRRGSGWWTGAWNFVSEETLRPSGRRLWRIWRRLPSWPQRPACAAGVLLRRCVSLQESGSPGTRGVACPGSTRSGQGCGAGETADVLVDGGGGRGRSRIGGCPRWRAVVVGWFDVPGALRVGPATMSEGFRLEEMTRGRGRKRSAGAGFGVAVDGDAGRLPVAAASCAARKRVVDRCLEFCF